MPECSFPGSPFGWTGCLETPSYPPTVRGGETLTFTTTVGYPGWVNTNGQIRREIGTCDGYGTAICTSAVTCTANGIASQMSVPDEFPRPSSLVLEPPGFNIQPPEPVAGGRWPLTLKFEIKKDTPTKCDGYVEIWWSAPHTSEAFAKYPISVLKGSGIDERDDLRARKCPINPWGSATFETSSGAFSLSYHSEQHNQSPSSFGYGWSLDGFYANLTTKLNPDEANSQFLFFNNGLGSYERWTVRGLQSPVDSRTYEPYHSDNYITVSRLASGEYILKFKDHRLMTFRADGKLVSEIDRNGLVTTYTPIDDDSDRLQSVTDSEGRGVLFEYTGDELQPTSVRETSTSDGTPTPTLGPQTTFQYDPATNRLWKVTSPTGEVQEFLYTGTRLSKVIDPHGKVVTEYFYLSSGRVDYEISYERIKSQRSEEVDPNNPDNLIVTTVVTDLLNAQEPVRTTVTTLDRWRQPIKVVDPLENVSEYQYNDFESPYLVTLEMDPTGEITRYSYDNRGNLKTTTDAQGNVTTLFYAQETETPLTDKHMDMVTQIKRPLVEVNGSSVQYSNTILGYDSNGNLISITDAAEPTPKTTLYEVRLTDGRVLSVTDRNNNKTEFKYTSNVAGAGNIVDTTTNVGNLKSITTPSGPNGAPARTTTFSYNRFDDLLSSSGPGNNAASYQWDDSHRRTRVTDALARYTQYNYLNGRLNTVDLPTNQGSGAARRGARFQYSDANSSLVTKVEALKAVGVYEERVNYTFDSFSRNKTLSRLRDGSSKTWMFSYDILDRGTLLEDPRGRKSSTRYAPYCKNFTQSSPSKTEQHTVMDSLCQVIQLNTPEQTRTFEYDQLGRLTVVRQKMGSDSRYEPTNRDDVPLPARFGTARYQPTTPVEEVRTYEYNSLDRLTKITYPDGTTTDYVYDFEGRVTSVKDPNGNFTLYEYYNDDRLYKVTLQRSGFGDLVFTYSYDAAGRLYEIEYPPTSGIVAQFYDASANSGWDAAGQLRLVRYVKGATILLSIAYDYDDSGNRTQEVRIANGTTVTTNFTYDWLDRLLTMSRNGSLKVTYGYDESDNRISEVRPSGSKIFVHDDANQLVSSTIGGVTENFTHDLDGNMTSRTVGGVTTNYHWDQDFRLKRINSGPDHLYDAEGIRKKAGATNFYSSGAASIADRGTANLTFVQGHQILASADGSNVLYYLHDGLSSVRMLTDSAGAVTATLDYSEFGAPTTASTNPHTYVGGLGVRNETSATSNLFYMRARWYASDLGRFISADPIGFAGGLNLYTYSSNNPVSRVDPSGLSPRTRWKSTPVSRALAPSVELLRPLYPVSAESIDRMIQGGAVTIGSTPGAGARTTPFGITIDKETARCDGKAAFGKKLLLAATLYHERKHFRVKNALEFLGSAAFGNWAHSELEQNQAELDFLVEADVKYNSHEDYDSDSRLLVNIRIQNLRSIVTELQASGSYPPNAGNSIPDLLKSAREALKPGWEAWY